MDNHTWDLIVIAMIVVGLVGLSVRRTIVIPVTFAIVGFLLGRRRTIVIPVTFGVVGFLLGGLTAHTPLTMRPPPEVVEYAYPLPHHIPKIPGNLTLRFAMVHDVVHETLSGPRQGLLPAPATVKWQRPRVKIRFLAASKGSREVLFSPYR